MADSPIDHRHGPKVSESDTEIESEIYPSHPPIVVPKKRPVGNSPQSRSYEPTTTMYGVSPRVDPDRNAEEYIHLTGSSRYHSGGMSYSSHRPNMFSTGSFGGIGAVHHKNNFRNVPTKRIMLNRFVFVFTWICLGSILFLTIFDEQHGKSTASQLATIFIPLLVYLGNTLVCYYLNMEAIIMRTEGYSHFYESISAFVRYNFELASIYFVTIFSIYCFGLHNGEIRNLVSFSTRSWIVFFLWSVGFLIVLWYLYKILSYVTEHNREQPTPDLLHQTDVRGPLFMHGSPSMGNPPASNQEMLVQQLYNERKALKKQVENINKELTRVKQLNKSGMEDIKDTNGPSAVSLQERIRGLEDLIRNERQTVIALKAEIETQKYKLDIKAEECDKHRISFQTSQAKIHSLATEKQEIERETSNCQDEIRNLQTMLEVKDEEIIMAQKELARIRQKQKRKRGGVDNQSPA